jgi:hypothetical protein
MDIEGTNQIDLRPSAETSVEKASVVVDLSEVDFMASVGIGSTRNRRYNVIVLLCFPLSAFPAQPFSPTAEGTCGLPRLLLVLW